MKQPLVSIIIVNWNGVQWLPACFESLYIQNYPSFEIIFVDNASSDSSVAWVRVHYPEVKIILNKTNLGFAGGNNVGFKAARGSMVLFLNNDTRVTKTFLSELVQAVSADPKIGGVQSKILLMDKPDHYDSVGAYLTPTGFLYHFGFGSSDSPKYDKQFNLYTAKGACMLFKKTVLNAVTLNGNIFDPDYFAYFEETDLCHRIWLAGYRIVYAPASVIYHKMGATSSKMDNAFVQFHSFKNRIATYLKNVDAGHLAVLLPVHLFYCELYAFACLFRGKFSLFAAIQNAIWWNISHWSKMSRSRAIVQNDIRKVPDAAFWQKILKRPSFQYYLNFYRGDYTYEET